MEDHQLQAILQGQEQHQGSNKEISDAPPGVKPGHIEVAAVYQQVRQQGSVGEMSDALPVDVKLGRAQALEVTATVQDHHQKYQQPIQEDNGKDEEQTENFHAESDCVGDQNDYESTEDSEEDINHDIDESNDIIEKEDSSSDKSVQEKIAGSHLDERRNVDLSVNVTHNEEYEAINGERTHQVLTGSTIQEKVKKVSCD